MQPRNRAQRPATASGRNFRPSMLTIGRSCCVGLPTLSRPCDLRSIERTSQRFPHLETHHRIFRQEPQSSPCRHQPISPIMRAQRLFARDTSFERNRRHAPGTREPCGNRVLHAERIFSATQHGGRINASNGRNRWIGGTQNGGTFAADVGRCLTRARTHRDYGGQIENTPTPPCGSLSVIGCVAAAISKAHRQTLHLHEITWQQHFLKLCTDAGVTRKPTDCATPFAPITLRRTEMKT